MSRHVQLKRAYEKSATSDGFRVLVDRLWPRGVSKVDLRIDRWEKAIAPSTELRQWFDHDPAKWVDFRRRYKTELRRVAAQRAIEETIRAAKEADTITLIYGAKDAEHNEAVVLRDIFQRRLHESSAMQRGTR